jgi:hypothetical protein
MSKGNDSRTGQGRESAGRTGRDGKATPAGRTSRSSVLMTAERARAIQAHADRTGTNDDFKSRAMSAVDRNGVSETNEE